jgi:hypothetical protein
MALIKGPDGGHHSGSTRAEASPNCGCILVIAGFLSLASLYSLPRYVDVAIGPKQVNVDELIHTRSPDKLSRNLCRVRIGG